MTQETPEYRKEFGAAHDSASGATQDKWEFVLKLYCRHLQVKMPMAARPMCGIVVQDGANKILGLDKYQPLIGQQDGMEQTKAIADAMQRFNKYKPRDWDDGKDAEEFEAFKEYIPDMILHASEGVRERFKAANMIEGEYQRWHNEEKIDVPVMLYQDYSGGGIQCDLKAKPPTRNPLKKDGTRSWRVPKVEGITPTAQQQIQQAVYYKATGEPPSLLYVSASGYYIADADNCDQLKPDALEKAYAEAVRSWQISQNLLKAANGSWRTLAGLVQPDFNEIARRHGPSIVDVANQLWRF